MINKSQSDFASESTIDGKVHDQTSKLSFVANRTGKYSSFLLTRSLLVCLLIDDNGYRRNWSQKLRNVFFLSKTLSHIVLLRPVGVVPFIYSLVAAKSHRQLKRALEKTPTCKTGSTARTVNLPKLIGKDSKALLPKKYFRSPYLEETTVVMKYL